ncbi:unnamed protein product, partial [Rotaria magnacalcarata]
MFSLTCDESTLEQLCVGTRSVNDNYEIFEDVLGLYELSRQNAEAIVEVIFDILTRCGLNISACRVQSHRPKRAKKIRLDSARLEC